MLEISTFAHICQEISGATTSTRSIINTRDEPHAEAERYRRLHIIVGDSNMSEVATYLKLGTTALVLDMIEDRFFGLLEEVPRDVVGRQVTLAVQSVAETVLVLETEDPPLHLGCRRDFRYGLMLRSERHALQAAISSLLTWPHPGKSP